GWFSFDARYGITEIALQRFDVSAVPRHFNGMTDGPLDTRRGGFKFLRNRGIQYLGYRAHCFHIVDCHHNCLAQILIALDMRRHADLMDYLSHTHLERFP